MEWLTEIFAHVCGQGRCFVADGAPLPVCQRCFGLYLGVAVTGVWLAVSGVWRRGLPSWSVFVVNVVMLLVAMVAGLRVIDGAAAWRVMCGAWTGHVAALWLVGAAVHLRRLRKAAPQLPWRRRDKVQALAAAPVLAALALAAPTQSLWHIWSAAVAAGAVLLAVGLAAAGASLAAYLLCLLGSCRARRRRG